MDQGSMLDLDRGESSMGGNRDRLAVGGQMHGFGLHQGLPHGFQIAFNSGFSNSVKRGAKSCSSAKRAS